MGHDDQAAHLALEVSEHLATFVLGSDRWVMLCNDEFSRLTAFEIGDDLRSGLSSPAPLTDFLIEILDDHSKFVTLTRSYRSEGSERIAAIEYFRSSDTTGIGVIRDRLAPPGVEVSLAEEKNQYHAVLDRLRAGIVVHGPTSAIRWANERAAGLLGWHPENLIGVKNSDCRWEFFREDGSPMQKEEYPAARVLVGGEVVEDQVVGLRRWSDKQLIWLLCDANPVYSADEKVFEAVVSFTDITRLKSVERKLQESEERLRLVLEGSNDAPWDIDVKTGERYVSARWWTMLGREPAEVPRIIDGVWTEWFHPEDKARTVETYHRCLADPNCTSFQLEYRLLHAYGHYVPVLARGVIVRGNDGSALRVCGTNTDLTDQKRAEQQAYQLAFFDQLTDLPNRQLLIQQLNKSVLQSSRSKRNGALLLVDLDSFTSINDTLGHETGDLLLKEVARRLKKCVRPADTVGRLGGDEFVVVLDHLSESLKDAAIEAEQMAEKISVCLREGYTLSGTNHDVTASIGITLFDGSDTNIESVLRQVDLAMYEAKSIGPGSLRFFDLKMQTAVDERLGIERELRHAIQHEQMSLYFQPQVSVEGRVLGAEALLRWNHPQRGMVMPAVFIPIAESSALIVPLGIWVLQTACIQIKKWESHAVLSRLSLSVNVSVRQFTEPDFVDQVLTAIAESGANPNRLRLEVTESLLAKDIELIIAKMNRLKQIGIGFSLDDFGTGYSSLYYLHRLPLNELKIDRAFVQDVLSNPQNSAIARIIITLAETLELTVIAEGVESEEQMRFLESSGCDAFQGYLFGPPAPVEAFEAESVRRNSLPPYPN